jgi:hypothetical protein
MNCTITATEAASTARTTVRQIRAWCRAGQLAAVKVRGRWAIRPSAVARLLCPASDRPSRGEHLRQQSGRVARRTDARCLARATSREYRIPLIGHHQRARLALANTGHLLARDYLFDLGMDIDDIEEFESAFGRRVAETYRKRHHVEPDARGLIVLHGRLWRCNRFSDSRDLHAGACAYARTRGLFEAVA